MISPVLFEDYRDECNAAYQKFKSNLPRGDKAAYDLAVKPIFDYCATLSSAQTSEVTTRGIVARMHAAKDQFTGLVWLVLSHLMYIFLISLFRPILSGRFTGWSLWVLYFIRAQTLLEVKRRPYLGAVTT